MSTHLLLVCLLTFPYRYPSDYLTTTKALLENQKLFPSQNDPSVLLNVVDKASTSSTPHEKNKSSIVKRTITTAQKSALFLSTEKTNNDIFGIWDPSTPSSTTMPTDSQPKFTSSSLMIEKKTPSTDNTNIVIPSRTLQPTQLHTVIRSVIPSMARSWDIPSTPSSTTMPTDSPSKSTSSSLMIEKKTPFTDNTNIVIPSSTLQPTEELHTVIRSVIPSMAPIRKTYSENISESRLPPSPSVSPVEKPTTKRDKFVQNNQKITTETSNKQVGSDSSPNSNNESNNVPNDNEKPKNNNQQVISTITQTHTKVSPHNNNQQVVTTSTKSNTKFSMQSSSTEVQNSLQHPQPQQQQQEQNNFQDTSSSTFKQEKVKNNNIFIENNISIQHAKPARTNKEGSDPKNEISINRSNDSLSAKSVKGSYAKGSGKGKKAKSNSYSKTKASTKGSAFSAKKISSKGSKKEVKNNYNTKASSKGKSAKKKGSKKYSTKKAGNKSSKSKGKSYYKSKEGRMGKSGKGYISNHFHSSLKVSSENTTIMTKTNSTYVEGGFVL